MLSLDYTKRKGAAFDLLLKMYKNKSIIRKNRCKKHMKITIARTTVTYVGKKIMELVNCIMFIIAKIKGVKKRFSIKKTRPTPQIPSIGSCIGLIYPSSISGFLRTLCRKIILTLNWKEELFLMIRNSSMRTKRRRESNQGFTDQGRRSMCSNLVKSLEIKKLSFNHL
jgi:hypothetical protein